jgi:hypothetical protein
MLQLRTMPSAPRSSRWSGAAGCQGIVELNMVDIPRSPDDLHHTNLVFERAGASVAV